MNVMSCLNVARRGSFLTVTCFGRAAGQTAGWASALDAHCTTHASPRPRINLGRRRNVEKNSLLWQSSAAAQQQELRNWNKLAVRSAGHARGDEKDLSLRDETDGDDDLPSSTTSSLDEAGEASRPDPRTCISFGKKITSPQRVLASNLRGRRCSRSGKRCRRCRAARQVVKMTTINTQTRCRGAGTSQGTWLKDR